MNYVRLLNYLRNLIKRYKNDYYYIHIHTRIYIYIYTYIYTYIDMKEILDERKTREHLIRV